MERLILVLLLTLRELVRRLLNRFGRGILNFLAHPQNGDTLLVPKSVLAKIAPFIPVPGIGFYIDPIR